MGLPLDWIQQNPRGLFGRIGWRNKRRCDNGEIVPPRTYIFRLQHRSLPRGIILCLAAFLISLRLSGFPDVNALHLSRWQIVPVLMTCWSMVETLRCADRTWSLYYAGVLILLYSEVMILGMAVFLFFYP
jgi:hypothetical protein